MGRCERGVSGRERITLLPSIIADCDMAEKRGVGERGQERGVGRGEGIWTSC